VNVLQETPDELQGWQDIGFQLARFSISVAEGDPVVVQLDDTVVAVSPVA
jgi:hypothetical protein